jgi:hypothetical protein
MHTGRFCCAPRPSTPSPAGRTARAANAAKERSLAASAPGRRARQRLVLASGWVKNPTGRRRDGQRRCCRAAVTGSDPVALFGLRGSGANQNVRDGATHSRPGAGAARPRPVAASRLERTRHQQRRRRWRDALETWGWRRQATDLEDTRLPLRLTVGAARSEQLSFTSLAICRSSLSSDLLFRLQSIAAYGSGKKNSTRVGQAMETVPLKMTLQFSKDLWCNKAICSVEIAAPALSQLARRVERGVDGPARDNQATS